MILFCLFAVSLLSLSRGELYLVMQDSRECPTNDDLSCFSLNDPVSSSIFSSNSIITFSRGTHNILNSDDHSFLIKNVYNLTLIGNEQEPCRIMCGDPMRFVFMNITKLTISHLSFVNCGAPTSRDIINEANSLLSQPFYIFSPMEHIALFLVHIVDFEMSYVSILNSTGHGLLGFNIVGESSISQSNFNFNNFHTHNNHSYCQTTEGVFECTGGNLFIGYADTPRCLFVNENFVLNITSSFFGNGASFVNGSVGAGLTVVIAQSSYGVRVNIDNVTSVNNSAKNGANIALVQYGVSDNSSFILSNSFSGYSNPHFDPSTVLVLDTSTYVGGGLVYSYGKDLPTNFRIEDVCFYKPQRHESNLISVVNTTFFENQATTGSGAYIPMHRVADVGFVAQISFENCNFSNNIGNLGSALYIDQLESIETILFAQFSFTDCAFEGNSHSESFNHVVREVEYDILNTFFLRSVQDVVFKSCQFSDNRGTAIHAYNTRMRFLGTTTFERNRGVDGGALAIHGNSIMLISSNTSIVFRDNRAQRGGAIYVANQNYRSRLLCFWQIDERNLEDIGVPIELTLPTTQLFINISISNALDIHLRFAGNMADAAGSALYGGFIDSCRLIFTVNHPEYTSEAIFDDLFEFEDQTSSEAQNVSVITSDPHRVCICSDNEPQCDKSTRVVPVYPGETFYASLITVGQRNNPSPGIVHAHLKYHHEHFDLEGHIHTIDHLTENTSSILGFNQEAQPTHGVCSNLKYTISSTLPELVLDLTSDNSIFEEVTTHISVILKPCPAGFSLNTDPPVCMCNQLLTKFGLECHIETQTIRRVRPFWIGKEVAVENGSVEDDKHIIFGDLCPFDYCLPTEFDLNLGEQDRQCNYNRTGILCGVCAPGLSNALGCNECRRCSNVYLLLIVVFAVVGLLLVFSLYICNTLTVSVGTLNGLIFYANIIQVNKELFFPPGHYNPATVFIAWLNLDLGIRICFFDGLDTYVKTWLQFLFPIYIFVILAIIIVVSHYSSSASKMFTKRAVPVLATIFLLFFSKLHKTTINCLAFLNLQHSVSGDVSVVWSFDANLPYLQGKHIPLFIAGILLTLFFITPFVLVLLFYRPLQALSSYPLFRWVNKLKPLFDAYMGPFKDNYHYWTGLLLLLRGCLYIVYAIYIFYGPYVSLLVTAIVTQLLSIFTWFSGGVYKKWQLNALEFSFFLNLSLLSTATMYIRAMGDNPEDQSPVIYTSVAIAFIEFVGIVVYSIYTKIIESSNPNMVKLCERVQTARENFPQNILSRLRTQVKKRSKSVGRKSTGKQIAPSSSVVTLSEWEAEGSFVGQDQRFIELRESILASSPCTI